MHQSPQTKFEEIVEKFYFDKNKIKYITEPQLGSYLQWHYASFYIVSYGNIYTSVDCLTLDKAIEVKMLLDEWLLIK